MSSGHLKIDTSWTLFLDRDGVINRRIIDDYVCNYTQFEFISGVKEALRLLKPVFSKIIVVSNQQGIGKGLMSIRDVENIHSLMAEDILKSGGKIDRTYFSPSLEAEHSILRKPNIGMALLARKEFPGISFKKSVMVGDSISDMVFGKRLKMKTVLLSSDLPMIRKGFRVIDHVYPDLLSFAHVLTTNPII